MPPFDRPLRKGLAPEWRLVKALTMARPLVKGLTMDRPQPGLAMASALVLPLQPLWWMD